MLRDAGSPVKTAQLLKKFQVPKKKLNQLLHKMKQESKGVMLTGPATWCLGDGGTQHERSWYRPSPDLDLGSSMGSALEGACSLLTAS